MLNYNGKFLVSQKQLARQGRKAMFAVRSNVSDLELNHCTLFSLFDTYVASILLFGCEVWGSHAGNNVEKVHLDFWENVLGVKKKNYQWLIYAETGRLHLKAVRLIRIFKFWFKLLYTESCILGDIYKYFLRQCNDMNFRGNNWLMNVKNELYRLGLGYMWLEQDSLCFSTHFSIVKRRIIDTCVQSILAYIDSINRCIVYKHLIDHVNCNFIFVNQFLCTLRNISTKLDCLLLLLLLC